jgi:hypothetical protein
VAVILLVIAWIDGAGLEFQARAMSCCTHRHDCSGNISAPDKCCEQMGHAAPAKTGTVVHSSHVIALVPVAVTAQDPRVQQVSIFHSNGWVRAHDPPHLHTFALLI